MDFRRSPKKFAKMTFCQNQGFLVKKNTVNKLLLTNIEKFDTELNEPGFVRKHFFKKNYFLENKYLTGKNDNQ